MIEKPFNSITKQDIDSLIEHCVAESKTLEYKQELPGRKDDDKKEFLADVSSFANASGGDIIYGISERRDETGKKTGEPDRLCPISETTADEVIRRLDDMIRQGIASRFQYQIREVSGWSDDGKEFIILIRIPKSFSSPHMVIFKDTSRFFSRSSAGKHQLDVQEIRSAFLATESQTERIKRFREDRISKILADETPVILSSPDRLVFHIIPIQTFLNRDRIDIINNSNAINNFDPLYRGDWSRYNIDGYLSWTSHQKNEPAISYCQLFYDASLEAIYSGLLIRNTDNQGNERNIIDMEYEELLIKAFKKYSKGYNQLSIQGPFVISLSILGCKGGQFLLNNYFQRDEPNAIDRDVILIPEIILENLLNTQTSLKPLFDSIWNACGYARCLNYDNDGNRIQR